MPTSTDETDTDRDGPDPDEPAPDLDLSPHWSLDPRITFLNHGSFGACPVRIQNHQSELRDQLESEPVRFFARELPRLLDRARAELAEFVGTGHDNLAFVTNTTEAISSVLRSIDFDDGDEILITDHTYGACKNASRFVADRTGASVAVATLPFPVDEPDEIVEAVVNEVTDETRLALLDDITAFSALQMPIARLVETLRDRGVDVLVDGAHAPGIRDLNLDELDAAYYVGNCHKWLCSPRGAAFLRVRDDLLDSVRPLAISHGAGLEDPDRSRFHLEFDWTGTRDPTAWLCVPEVVKFLAQLVPDGWDGIRRRNRRLAHRARKMLIETVGTDPLCPGEMLGFAAAVELPEADEPLPDDPFSPDPLQSRLFEEHGIEVPIFNDVGTPGRRLLRVSCHLYNRLEDYEKLARVLDEELD